MDTHSSVHSGGGPSLGRAAENRRGFLAQVVALIGGSIALMVPVVVGIVTSLNPLSQKGSGGRFFRLTSLDLLPEGGPPQRIPVIAERIDAWNRFPDEPIGTVWLRRTGPKTVEALSAVCPHAGCAIQYRGPDEAGQTKAGQKKAGHFACPCHKAVFELSGPRVAGLSSDSPRDMDSLEVRIENETEVWVKFQNFDTGIAEKVART